MSYIPLCIKYRIYEDEKGRVITSPMVIATLLLWVGSMLNKIVISANNGMPVFPSNSYWTGYIKPDFIQDGIHILGNAYMKLIPLTDIYDFGLSIVSIGDILVRMYAFLIIYYAIKESNKIIKIIVDIQTTL